MADGPIEKPGLNRYLAIALVSCSILLYEVAITRLLSVVLWYHFAFLSLSLAMLGLGAPGVWFALRRQHRKTLPRTLLVAALATPLSVVAIISIGKQLAHAGISGTHPAFVGFVVICILLPMLALGSAVCLLLLAAPGKRVGWMYGADLLGAALGALLVVPLLGAIPTPLLLAATGFLPLCALWILRQGYSAAGLGVALTLVVSLLWQTPYRLAFTKNYVEKKQLLFEDWSATARVTVLDQPAGGDGEKSWGWGIGSRFVQRPAEQRWIDQDGSAGTPIEHYTGDNTAIEHLAFDVTGVGYQLAEPASVCIIGPGGGRDILTARLFGAKTIDAAELNPGIYLAMTTVMQKFSGNVYQLPGVHSVVSEGRSYLTRQQKEYDFIQISLVDSWTATAAGAYALSENYLYTTQAMQLYWSRLNSTGTLSISRWMLGNSAMEAPRLVLMALWTLRQLGVEHPKHHIAVIGAGGVATMLVFKTPLTAERLSRLDQIVEQRGFRRHWPAHPATTDTSAIALVLQKGGSKLSGLGMDLSPPTDDRPFFFQMASLLTPTDSQVDNALNTNDRAVHLLRWLLIILSGLVALLLFAPLLISSRLPQGQRWVTGSGYFALIGLGFMLAEVPWIQRFILYLGHPSYATTAVLASLLCGAGLGATMAPRFGIDKCRRYALLLPVVIGLVTLVSAPLCTSTLGLPLSLRVLITVLLLAPAGFVMGFAFPLGMIVFGDDNKAWNWAINGAFGVLGSVVSLALAMLLGFNGVTAVATCAYLAAVILLRNKRGLHPNSAKRS